MGTWCMEPLGPGSLGTTNGNLVVVVEEVVLVVLVVVIQKYFI